MKAAKPAGVARAAFSSATASNSAIAADVRLGRGVRLSPLVNLYGCSIGDQTVIGAFVEVQSGASIGRRCKVSSHSFICAGVTIEDEVFIGHGVVFINDRRPRATTAQGELKTGQDWTMERTVVCRRASIGSGAVIMCGVVIGESAMVGAGALVTHDVAPGTVVTGSPARVRTLTGAKFKANSTKFKANSK